MATDEQSRSDSEDRYRMTVDLNVLDHLGVNLYSNIAAVLSEVVANAWDADAERVSISFENNKRILIEDDGKGMSVSDMNEKYLRVGYRRRNVADPFGAVTAKGRPVMGRKGLGKLALFSIAETIEVQSATGGDAHGLRMTMGAIRASVNAGDPYYRPDVVDDADVVVTKGTRIVLDDVRRSRIGIGKTALRKRLARRFSIVGAGHGFAIDIDGKDIGPSDRDDLTKAQFVWIFGDTEVDLSKAKSVKERGKLTDEVRGKNNTWHVKGWIATVAKPKDLDVPNVGNLNGIVAIARGRLIHENLLDKLSDGQLYTKYVTGQIEVDFLDDDERDDIATSDRQRIIEDDPRYVALQSFLKARLVEVEKQWSIWRRTHEVKAAKTNSPALNEWLEMLPERYRPAAESLIAKLSALTVEDEEDRKVLYRHGILAFERLKLGERSSELAQKLDDTPALLELLADKDSLEAALYRDIVKSRLEAVSAFKALTDENSKEKVLQAYLFDHLWLLDPSWERATGSEVMESRLIEAGLIVSDLTEKEKLGRVDITYRTMAGKHLIIELKRASRKMGLMELSEQGMTYVDKLRKILASSDATGRVSLPDIEVVFVLGKPVDEQQDKPARFKSAMDMVSPGSRVILYDGLIHGALTAYEKYLEESRKIDRLGDIVDRL